MATYDYVCDECGERKEVEYSIKAPAPDVYCLQLHAMRKDVAASFPHVSLLWHRDQGIGAKLVLQSTKRQGAHGDPSNASSA